MYHNYTAKPGNKFTSVIPTVPEDTATTNDQDTR
jgi:hypothetical protein